MSEQLKDIIFWFILWAVTVEARLWLDRRKRRERERKLRKTFTYTDGTQVVVEEVDDFGADGGLHK